MPHAIRAEVKLRLNKDPQIEMFSAVFEYHLDNIADALQDIERASQYQYLRPAVSDLFKQIQAIRRVLILVPAERISEFVRNKTEIVAPSILFNPPQIFVGLIKDANRLIKGAGKCVEKNKAYVLFDEAKRQLFRALDIANARTLGEAAIPEARVLILQAQTELALLCFMRREWWDEAIGHYEDATKTIELITRTTSLEFQNLPAYTALISRWLLARREAISMDELASLLAVKDEEMAGIRAEHERLTKLQTSSTRMGPRKGYDKKGIN